MRAAQALSSWFPVLFLLFCQAAPAGQSSLPGDPQLWFNPDPAGPPYIALHFFWSNRCPHCLEARPFIRSLESRYDWLYVHSYELNDAPENRVEFLNMTALLGTQPASVPTFILCGKMHVGWGGGESSEQFLEQRLLECHRQLYPDAAGARTGPLQEGVETPAIEVPLLGRLDTAQLSLPMLTLVLAGMDAFNPCAFFVLLFLLSMLVHTRSRRLMLLVGGVFVLISGLMYFAFMAAWLNLFLILGELDTVTVAAGIIAITIALINIKDYFWLREGVSLTLSEAHKHSLFRRSRSLLRLDSVPALLAGTLLLAVVANLYELLCTAGFPLIYTRILTLNELSIASHYLHLALYNVIYIVPMLLIVALFVITLGARKLKESEGRFLKLLSGAMMLALGTLLLVAPQRLNSLVTAAALLLAALLGALLVTGLTRMLRSTRNKPPV